MPHPEQPSPPTPLTPRQCKRLRELAHGLRPVVQVGASGVTDGVVAAVHQALDTHELIKVRMREPEDKQAMAQALATATGAALCGLVGHTVILYRRHPDHPQIGV